MTAISTDSFRQSDFWKGSRKSYNEGPIKNHAVYVKIASEAIHGGLVPMYKHLRALQIIEDILEEYDSALIRFEDSTGGVMIVMKDLSETHEDLTSKKPEGNELKYWEGFEDLVTRLLRPAAKLKVCFVDLRMGYDSLVMSW